MAHHILLEGGLGAGKTFGMVLLSWYIKLQTEKRGAYIQLFSNFEAKDSIEIMRYQDWYKIAQAQGSICMWDEAHITFNNRAWAGKGSTVITDTMMYTRKMQSLQMYATPSINNVDSRLRQIIEIKITMRKEPRGFRFYFVDYQTGEHLRTVYISMQQAKKIFALQLYDTFSFVRRFPVPTTDKTIKEFFDRLEEIHDENRYKMMGKEPPKKKKAAVEDNAAFAWLLEKEKEEETVV